MKRFLLIALTLAIPGSCFAAASQGIAWLASKYEDGTPIESTAKVVYMVFAATDNRQVGSTFNLVFAASLLPTDGCYYIKAAIYDQPSNAYVPGTMSDASATVCTKAPVRKVAAPIGVIAQ